MQRGAAEQLCKVPLRGGYHWNVDTKLDSCHSNEVNLYDLDFNLGLRKPEVMRRPRFVPVGSLMYIMPKSLNGDLAVALSLRDEDLERLNDDEDWKKYATYIG